MVPDNICFYNILLFYYPKDDLEFYEGKLTFFTDDQVRLGTTIGIYFLGIVLQYVNHFSAFFTQTGTCLVPWWDFQACLDRFLQKCSIHGFIQVEDLIFKKIAGVHTDVPSDRKASSL